MKKPPRKPSPARRIRQLEACLVALHAILNRNYRDLAALGLDTPENRTLRLNRTIHNRIHRTHP